MGINENECCLTAGLPFFAGFSSIQTDTSCHPLPDKFRSFMASLDSRHESSPLIAAAGLGLFALLLIGGSVLAWRFWSASVSTTQTNVVLLAALANAYDSPADFKPTENLRQRLLSQVTPEQSASRTIQLQLEELERYIRKQTTGRAVVRPDWIERTFVGTGIDSEKFLVIRSGLAMNVRRYTGSKTAPKFSGNRAFQQFLINTMAPVNGCDDFRIDIRLGNLEHSGDEFKVTLLTEAAGSRKQSNDEWSRPGVGKNKNVVQVNSVWQTTWARAENKQLELLSVNVPAAEIVTLSLNEAKLFDDSTDSILANSGCLREQLIYLSLIHI